ncbi:hypothetical protein FJZ18_01125 [Candidatus Pacearchaeota archaeon]|nr:hypothetical protein [Candidatus Pacearchaeota archaeon]
MKVTGQMSIFLMDFLSFKEGPDYGPDFVTETATETIKGRDASPFILRCANSPQEKKAREFGVKFL